MSFFLKGAVLYLGRKKGPEFRELPEYIRIFTDPPRLRCAKLEPKIPSVSILGFRVQGLGFRV